MDRAFQQVKLRRRLIFFLFLCACACARAGEIRLGFLNSAVALREASQLLEKCGVPENGRTQFAKAVRDFYVEPLRLDRASFPPEQDGTFIFNSFDELQKVLPVPLQRSTHRWTLNCFDLVSILGEQSVEFRLDAEKMEGPFFAVVTETNGFSMRPAATAADAFSLAYPPWYRDSTAKYFPSVKQQNPRMGLTAILFTSYPLPLATSEETFSKSALDSLRSRWMRYRMKVTQCRIILGHEVNLAGKYFVTSHSGVMFRNGQHWTYFEKAGGAGPFVRLDFDDPAELKDWYALTFRQSGNDWTHFLMSIDDREVFVLRTIIDGKK